MRLYFLLFNLFFFTNFSFSQSGNWVWLKGDSLSSSIGNFGIKGIENSSNEPPARYQTAYWLDLQGNYWIFSGVAASNDLWKYNPITNNWTWIRGDDLSGTATGNYGVLGVPSPLNDPPNLGYGANCWTDATGDLWLFGGYSTNNNITGDNIWRYNIASNQWTWMGGTGIGAGVNSIYGSLGVENSINTPGARYECKSGWVFNNRLWLFGGMDNNFNTKNDIWSYNISNNLWAWQGGSQSTNFIGNFGTLGIVAPTNEPPARASYTKWQDANNFYLFAGITNFGMDSLGLNDIWKFDKNTKLWTWISGTNQVDDDGTFNSYCSPSTADVPQARYENQTAQTASTCVNAFWTFGGFNSNLSRIHNDLWLFNTSNLEWTKVKGETSTGNLVLSSYGTKGIPSATNLINGRGGPAVWSDLVGNLYIFGGLNNSGYLNDLWKFIPDTSCFKTGLIGNGTLAPPSNTTLCNGDTISIIVPSNAVINYTPTIGATYDVTNNRILFFGTTTTTYTVSAISLLANDPCFVGDTISFTISNELNPIADFAITPSVTTLINPTFSMVNNSANAVTYEWYDQNGNLISTAKDIVQTESKIGTYCYTLKVKNKCGVSDQITKCADIVWTDSIVKEFVEVPNAFSPNGNGTNDIFKPIIRWKFLPKEFKFIIYNRWGNRVYESDDYSNGWDGTNNSYPAPLGVYYYYLEIVNPKGEKLVYKGDVTLIR
jgi:gliding motility-associated-like protein